MTSKNEKPVDPKMRKIVEAAAAAENIEVGKAPVRVVSEPKPDASSAPEPSDILDDEKVVEALHEKVQGMPTAEVVEMFWKPAEETLCNMFGEHWRLPERKRQRWFWLLDKAYPEFFLSYKAMFWLYSGLLFAPRVVKSLPVAIKKGKDIAEGLKYGAVANDAVPDDGERSGSGGVEGGKKRSVSGDSMLSG